MQPGERCMAFILLYFKTKKWCSLEAHRSHLEGSRGEFKPRLNAFIAWSQLNNAASAQFQHCTGPDLSWAGRVCIKSFALCPGRVPLFSQPVILWTPITVLQPQIVTCSHAGQRQDSDLVTSLRTGVLNLWPMGQMWSTEPWIWPCGAPQVLGNLVVREH